MILATTGSPPDKENAACQGGVGKTNSIRQPDHRAGPANEPVGRELQFRCRLGRAIWRASYATEEEQTAVHKVAAEFFEIRDGFLFHGKVESEIAWSRTKSKNRSVSGKKGAAVTNRKRAANAAANAAANGSTNGQLPIPTVYTEGTLKLPDMAALDASAHRLELLGRMGNDCAAMALDAAASIKAGNSLEKMLAHQLAVTHKAALTAADKGTFQPDAEEKARMLYLACRMMETYQRGLLTLQRLRNNDSRYVNVTVADCSQAVVISSQGQSFLLNSSLPI